MPAVRQTYGHNDRNNSHLYFGRSKYPHQITRQSEYKHVLANISRSRCNTPAVWTKWNGAHSRRVHCIVRGVFAGMRTVRVRHMCGGPGGLPLGYAMHLHSVAIATQPVQRLQICPIVRN